MSILRRLLKETPSSHTIQAHGVTKSGSKWSRTFRDTDHMNQWASENEVEVHGHRSISGVKL